MKLRVVLILGLGFSLALYLGWTIGFGSIISVALAVGWSGFAVLCWYAVGLFFVLGAACGVLLPSPTFKGILIFVWARMVRDSATELLPFSSVGGLVFGARAAIAHGIPSSLVFASTIVDVTTELLAQVGYIALGIGIFAARIAHTSITASLTKVLVIEFILASIAAGAIIAAQRYRQKIAVAITERFFPSAGLTAAGVTAALDAIYQSRARVAVSLALHFFGWIASAVGVWIAFRLMGLRVELDAVIGIESLVCAARSAAFFVPNALGVQEGAYALLAPLLAVGSEVGFGVSLLKRARDIAIGVPILLIWQVAESRRALRRAPG
ncbi:MAG: lysylphosphatidylglycerol synthase domain-containing protein [Pseudomonadota bacterium]|nr:lysylphosphatidylglycerol synthase domain-containing protein [Pseudomonadota bacterium]